MRSPPFDIPNDHPLTASETPYARDMQPDVLIDGDRFCDYDGFVKEFNRAYLAVFPGPEWDGKDFDDLDDFLEAPGIRLRIRWINSRKSRSELGHDAMASYWRKCLMECQASFPAVLTLLQGYQERIDLADEGRGDTLFDWLASWLQHDEYVDFSAE